MEGDFRCRSNVARFSRAVPPPPSPRSPEDPSRASWGRRPLLPNAARRSASCVPSLTSATGRCGCTCRRASPTGRSTTPRSTVTLDDGTALPGRHDGMGAFRGPERQRRAGPQPRGQQLAEHARRSGPARRTTPMARRRHDHDRGDHDGEVISALHEPERHDDELLRRPDAVGHLDHLRGDGQRPRRRPRLHRRVQHRAAEAARLHLRGAGRTASQSTGSRSREPAASPTRRCRSTRRTAILYLTEDNFAFPSGFYRYTPAEATR